MKTVSSVSGGKSSTYMALHYPTDYYIFSVVLTEDTNAIPKDPGLLKEAQNRIPGFIASREVDLTLKNMLELEQKLGKEVKWVYATQNQYKPGMIVDNISEYPVPYTYDALIRYHKALPNKAHRWCTTQLKLYPIFWHTYLHIFEKEKDKVLMHIGYRKDEEQRAIKLLFACDSIQYPYRCPVIPTRIKHRWKTIVWRDLAFPLIDNNITKEEVGSYFISKAWPFPKVSNCDFCFFHTKQEFIDQEQEYPERIQWWKDKEQEIGKTWKTNKSVDSCFCTD